MYEAIVISDLHLGSAMSMRDNILNFISQLRYGDVRTNRLILCGDVIDQCDSSILVSMDWQILAKMRQLSSFTDIIWVRGNHDHKPGWVAKYIGATVVDEYRFASGDRSILCIHGHQFDNFIVEHPRLTWLAEKIYHLIQKFDPTHRLARVVKRMSKTYARCQQKVKEGAVAMAKETRADIVICGHTHQMMAIDGDVKYINAGCWTEKPCGFITIKSSQIEGYDYQ